MKYNHQQQSSTMIQYQLKQDKDRKMPQACGKRYATLWSAELWTRKPGRAHGRPHHELLPGHHPGAPNLFTLRNSVLCFPHSLSHKFN